MEIRTLKESDIPAVVELWYETSCIAHSFISSEYWKEAKDAMATQYIPASDTLVAEEDGVVAGFISMVGDYLAAVFVKSDMQGKGIGRSLLERVKENRSSIELKVYAKNKGSKVFYEKQGFRPVAETIEDGTGEVEFCMQWNR